MQTNWSSAVPDAVHSLCDDVFVRELLCHGVLSSRKEVAGHAHILLSQLLDLLANSEGKWTKETRKQMMTLLPYIEVVCNSSFHADTCVLSPGLPLFLVLHMSERPGAQYSEILLSSS